MAPHLVALVMVTMVAFAACQTPSPHPVANHSNVTSEGRAALDDARAQAQMLADAHRPSPQPTLNESQPHAVAAVAQCQHECQQLSDQLLDAVEGASCRSLFTTGKCPSPCVNAISAVTSNSSWPSCVTMCAGDIVSGAAQRWGALCDLRQETLVDKGKEAVKNFVADGLGAGLRVTTIMRFSVGALIVVMLAAYAYRRGALSSHIAYRLQKRRLLGRKNSDSSLPI